MKDHQAIKKLINTPQKIVITMHGNPDADALGSSLALATLLEKYHHQVHLISPNRYPDFLAWMPAIDKVLIYEEDNQAIAQEQIQTADTIFCIDFSSLHRLFSMSDIVKQATATKVIIDHHPNPEDFAQITIWDTKAPAAAQLVYNMIVAIGGQNLIDKSIATCLYTGILTDTGAFQNPNTNAQTHLITAKLLEKGVDIAKVTQNIYGNDSLTKLKFIAHVIKHRLVVMPDIGTAYFAIPSTDFKKFNLKAGDTDGLVNYTLRLKGIFCGILIKEEKNNIRLSFRSIGDLPVNNLAQKHFNGGGHKNAAGGTSSLTLKETVDKLKNIIQTNFSITKNNPTLL